MFCKRCGNHRNNFHAPGCASFDDDVDKARVLSSYVIANSRAREVRVPEYIETDERGVLRAVWST